MKPYTFAPSRVLNTCPFSAAGQLGCLCHGPELDSTFYKTLISEEIEESQIVSKSVLITKRPSNYDTPSKVMDFS